MIIAPRRESAIMCAPAGSGGAADPPGVPSARMRPSGPMKWVCTAANCNGARATRTRRVSVGIRRHVVRMNRSEEHTSELQSRLHLVCRLLLEKKKKKKKKKGRLALIRDGGSKI